MPTMPQNFRYDFLPVWRHQTAICTGLIFVVWLVLAQLTSRPLTRPDVFLSLGTAALCAVVLGIVTAAVRFQVTQEGLRTFNTFGRWRMVPWEAIAAVEPARYYFLPHLKLRVDGQKRSFWIPLFLHDMVAFRGAVIGLAGAEHPVSRALPLPASSARR